MDKETERQKDEETHQQRLGTERQRDREAERERETGRRTLRTLLPACSVKEADGIAVFAGCVHRIGAFASAIAKAHIACLNGRDHDSHPGRHLNVLATQPKEKETNERKRRQSKGSRETAA